MVLVSLLADQLFSQFLIFWGRPKRLTHFRDWTFFCLLSWLFCQLWILESEQFSKKAGKKNSREWTKKCPVSEIGQFSFGGLKNEKLTGQLVSQRDWPKPHGPHFCVVLITITFAKNQILTKEAGGDEENTTHFIGSPFPIYCPLPIPHYCHGD